MNKAIALILVAIAVAYTIFTQMHRGELMRARGAVPFFRELKEIQELHQTAHGAFYPLSGGVINDEPMISAALGYEGFFLSSNFAYRIVTGTDAKCGNWLQIEAVPMSAQGAGAANVAKIANRTAPPQPWAVKKAKSGQTVLFQTPMPAQNKVNLKAGWEKGVYFGNWISSSKPKLFGSFASCP